MGRRGVMMKGRLTIRHLPQVRLGIREHIASNVMIGLAATPNDP